MVVRGWGGRRLLLVAHLPFPRQTDKWVARSLVGPQGGTIQGDAITPTAFRVAPLDTPPPPRQKDRGNGRLAGTLL